MNTVIIDLEYTGLDNTYTNKHEILQLKAYCVETGKKIIKTFNCHGEITAGAFIKTSLIPDANSIYFDKLAFEYLISQITNGELIDVEYWGFSVTSDIKMLSKYDVNIFINDIKNRYLISEFEERIASEGSSLECVYYIVFGEVFNYNHGGMEELDAIIELYKRKDTLRNNVFMSFVPYGRCSGMPIMQYVKDFRRQADGYRFNNDDLFSQSLTEAIEALNYQDL